jgi:hypothetical protein
VAPGLKEIRVTFSKPLQGSWDCSPAWTNSMPPFEKTELGSDGRTWVLRSRLEPERTYAFWVQNLKDAAGLMSVPYLIIFQTKQN